MTTCETHICLRKESSFAMRDDGAKQHVRRCRASCSDARQERHSALRPRAPDVLLHSIPRVVTAVSMNVRSCRI